MRIVYCVNGIDYPGGGIDRVIINKANYLASHNIEVYIITAGNNGRPPAYPLDIRVKHYDIGINIYSHGSSFLPIRSYQYFKNLFDYKRALINLLERIQPDIAISTFGHELIPLSHYKGRKILEYHFSRVAFEKYNRFRSFKFYDKWLHRQHLKAIKRYDRFVVLTQEDAKNWREFNHVIVIPNAKSFECQHPASLDNQVVLAVGRLTEQKGFDKLIQAWKIVSKEVKGWTLHIKGEGGLRDTLQKQIDDARLNESIFLDGISFSMKEQYRNASIFVMTSLYEGFGMALLEALTCGLPCIAFDCPCGPRDMISNDKNGFLVAESNIEEFADKLIYLMSHPEERKKMGKQAYLSSENFSTEKVMKQWRSLFDEVYANG